MYWGINSRIQSWSEVSAASQEMLGSQGIQPVTLVFNNSKNCFLQLSSNFATHLCLYEVCIQLLYNIGMPVTSLLVLCDSPPSNAKCWKFLIMQHYCDARIRSWSCHGVFLHPFSSAGSGPGHQVQRTELRSADNWERNLGSRRGNRFVTVINWNQCIPKLFYFFRISFFFIRILNILKTRQNIH